MRLARPAARLVSNPLVEAKPDGWTRFVCFSDTHGLHDKIDPRHIVEADVLLHAGDFTNTGELEQVQSLSRWLQAYPAREKVVIAGNHDITFQKDYYERSWSRYHRSQGRYDCEECRAALTDCIYLEDELIEVDGYTIYGSPWQPEFCDWAFNLERGGECRRAWEAIPDQVDVLMTHGPPHGIGDRCQDGFHAGCEDLRRAIGARVVPVHLSGHIHEGYGTEFRDGTLYINASTCTFHYEPTNPPIIFDLPPAATLREASQRRDGAEAVHPDLMNTVPSVEVGSV